MPKLNPQLLLFSFFLLSSTINVTLAGDGPLTPKASLIRYWKKHISNDLPKPWFLLNKASPLTAVQSATFSILADRNALSTHLPSFCSSANLFCFPDLTPSLEKYGSQFSFKMYTDKNFTNYATGGLDGTGSFKNYSDHENLLPIDSFRRYSRGSVRQKDQFSNYAPNTNVADQSFTNYGTHAAAGSGNFKSYAFGINDPTLKFNSYSDDANGRQQKFTSYSDKANVGDQGFTSYSQKGNGTDNEFTSYGNDSNVIGSTFTGYGQTANGAVDKFTSYAFRGNVPRNNFKNYGAGGNAAVESFASYRNKFNAGVDSFTSYAKDSNAAKVDFDNYGKSFFEGDDSFTGYAKGTAENHEIGFKFYGVNNTFNFKDYAKKGVSFKQYLNNRSSVKLNEMEMSGMGVNKWVEPGKFFREKMLKTGSVMPMPDIKDKMPERSFLPRVISSKLPFSSSKIGELQKTFHADENSTMGGLMADTLAGCERKPSRGETKRCVGSIEDMIDFATSVLGRNVAVRTTESTEGSKGNVMIGSVKGINGGKVTKSVSCHQSLYPYLLYYCHSVPKVRVFEADILDPNTKTKINLGIAICHVDTSDWSPTHGAFVALNSAPGKIEVCHWIFENDMNWAMAD